jgi:hypothetical protein
MHLILPFAAPLSEAGRQAWRSLTLPHLTALWSMRREPLVDLGDEHSLSPPHERAIARAFGLTGADGALPWAARAAQAAGIDTADLAWGLLTPVHLHVGTEQVTLVDPAALLLDAETSQAFLAVVTDLFTSEGFALSWLAPDAWLAAHACLDELPTASLDRVIGRNIDRWLPGTAAARLVRRLQNEVQMVLHTHALNEDRVASGLLPVNSFWLSGCGRHRPSAAPPGLAVDERLRGPALSEDWPAWSDAWRALDAGPLGDALARARRGDAVTLTLCGERAAAQFDTAQSSLWRRLTGGRADRRLAELVDTL